MQSACAIWSYKRHNFRTNIIEHKVVLSFYLQILCETLLTLRSIQLDAVTKVHMSSCKVHRSSCKVHMSSCKVHRSSRKVHMSSCKVHMSSCKVPVIPVRF